MSENGFECVLVQTLMGMGLHFFFLFLGFFNFFFGRESDVFERMKEKKKGNFFFVLWMISMNTPQ